MTQAYYFDGRTAQAHPVTLAVVGQRLQVRGDGIERDVPLAALSATDRLARVRRVIKLPDGDQVHCDDNDWVDGLFPRHGMSAWIDRLERHSAVVAGSVVTTALLGFAFFAFGLPWIAERAANAMPLAAETLLGEQSMRALDKTYLRPTKLSEEQQQVAREEFFGFVADMPDRDRYKLEFRELPGNAVNAFAVPGGTIVVSDAIVEALPDRDAFLSVVAHEMGHQVEHHVVRSVIQGSAVVVLVALFTADVSSASGVVLGVPAFLLDSHYSRDFESAADRYAFAAMRAHNISPEWFAYALGSIDQSVRSNRQSSDARIESYTSSHPLSTERIEAARAQAQGFENLEVSAARAMADVYGRGVTTAEASQVGCWVGSRKFEDDRVSRWNVTFTSDLAVRTRFDDFDRNGKLLQTSYESGRWAIRDGMMSLRWLVYESDKQKRDVDRIDTYRIESIDDEVEDYRFIPSNIEFESRRIRCGEESGVDDQ